MSCDLLEVKGICNKQNPSECLLSKYSKLNNKSAPSLKVLLAIERRKQVLKQPQEVFCKVGAPRNL